MSSKTLDVVLVRHGETEWSRTGRHTGRTDIALTELGRRQADQLAGMLAGRTFELAMSSPLIRARETYERAGISTDAEINSDLLEWDYGVYEGVSTPETQLEIPDWSVWTHPIIGGEAVDAVGDRADSVIGRVLHASGDVVLFAHGHFLRILAARWLGLPAEAGRHLALNTATVSTLGFERESHVIRRWNEGCHLRGIEATP
jgi:probable phosphoglycerate mutase